MPQFLSYKLELNVTFVRSLSHLYGEKEIMVKINQLGCEFLTPIINFALIRCKYKD